MRKGANEPPFGGPGMTKVERRKCHERWAARRSQLKPGTPMYEQYENGRQCGACRFFVTLEADIGMDWGVCCHPTSQHDGTAVFEHFTCSEFDNGKPR